MAEIPAEPGTPGFSITHDNTLLDHYPGTLGGKTGFTDLARQTYVGVAERNGRRLAVTLLGAETAPLGSLGEAAALLDWGFALPLGASVGRLVTPDEKKQDRPIAEVRGERHGHAGAGSPFSLAAVLGLGAVVLAAPLLAVPWRRRAARRAANP